MYSICSIIRAQKLLNSSFPCGQLVRTIFSQGNGIDWQITYLYPKLSPVGQVTRKSYFPHQEISSGPDGTFVSPDYVYVF